MGPAVFAPFSGLSPPAALHAAITGSGPVGIFAGKGLNLLLSFWTYSAALLAWRVGPHSTHYFSFLSGHCLPTHSCKLSLSCKQFERSKHPPHMLEWDIWLTLAIAAFKKVLIYLVPGCMGREFYFMSSKSDVLLISALWTFLGRFTCWLYWFFTPTDVNSDFRSAQSKCLSNRDNNEGRCCFLKLCQSGETNSIPESEQHPSPL